MRVTIGSDHAGFELKKILSAHLHQGGHQVLDVGTTSSLPVDYPDFAEAVARNVVEGKSERAVLICGSGVGASVTANKIRGVRASVCHDTYSAHQGVEHDDMNVLVLGSRIIGVELAKELVNAFLAAKYSHEERHQRRLDKMKAIESRNLAVADFKES